jgi:hypothetical protein
MANKIDEQLLDKFVEASGKQMSSLDDIQSIADQIAGSLADSSAGGVTPDASGAAPSGLQGQSASDVFGQSATPIGVSAHGGSTTSTGSSSGTTIGSVATTFLESGFGIVPLISGLLGLFGGGTSAPPALEKYAMPSAISFASADTGSGLSAADFDQMGAPRVYNSAADATAGSGNGITASGGVARQGSGSSSGGTNAASPQITVNVQTMDARSFLDNSDQIAQAVRGAMLNLSSVNDVVNEI